MDNRPIGIMDSGVGGLTVARVLRQKYPEESIIFIGDTANNPYGERTSHEINVLAGKMKKFLISKNVKMIIIACNTITFNVQKNFYDEKIPIEGMSLDLSHFENAGSITVFATPATINLHIHKNKIKEKFPNSKIEEMPCEGLAHAIEENNSREKITEILKKIMEKRKISPADIGIFACTHYPLVEDVFKKIWNKTKFWDPAESTVENFMKKLKKENKKSESYTEDLFYFTENAERAEILVKKFFGNKVSVKNIKLGC